MKRWYRRDRDGRIGRANDSMRRALPRGSTGDKVAFLKRTHPELTQKEIAVLLDLSLSTVERASSVIRKRSMAASGATSYKALGPVKLKSTTTQDQSNKNSSSVSGKTLPSPFRGVDPDYDPAEDIIHDTYPDGHPCVVDGVPFDFDRAMQEALARHATKPMPPAPPRPPSPWYDHLRPTLFPVSNEATTEEAWHALEMFRVSRHGNTCIAMEIAFVLDHFPSVPAKDTADMVGVSVSTVRRHKAKRAEAV
ncbi:hypothetical protein V5F77_20625 [Xanthobacter sp. DSM 24535]|uniref:hypothetical protein n=1 Tax=Roseixanthobacter psychrophilus TaxID=3119917 RepID=UPI003726824C